MIGKLTGRASIIDNESIIIDVNGVGYIVYVSTETISNIINDTQYTIWIHTQVKEGEMTLFGFLKTEEKKWFELLITVQGIGGKVALSILSSLKPEMLFHSIMSQDTNVFKKVSGVGPKLASRIINELKDKKSIHNFEYNNNPSKLSISSVAADAASALENLGFVKAEAFKIANQIISERNDLTIEDVIKSALQKMSR